MRYNWSSRRDAMGLMAGATAVPFLGSCAEAQSQTEAPIGAQAESQTAASTGSNDVALAQGQPMPGGVQFPDAPVPRPSEDSVGYAIVGLGGYALRQMMPAFARTNRSHIAALVSGNAEKCARVAESYGVPQDACYSYDDFDRIAEDDRIDVVYIVLPSGLHAEYTERAFAAGKHVLCEKPMALSSDECERMIAASEAANRKLMIAYRCHFEPHNLLAMELMRGQAVGDLRLFRANQQYRMGPTSPSENWRVNKALAGHGPMEDYGLYGLQGALYLTGEMPNAIAARTHQPAGDPRFEEIVASVATLLEFPSGATAELFTSYDAYSLNRHVMHGTTGRLDMMRATGYGGHDYRLIQGGEEERLSPGDPATQFSGQLDHFSDAVRDDTPIRTPGEMGLRDVRLMEAIFTSARSGRMVRLNPDGTARL